MMQWVAISYGALDVSSDPRFKDAELLVVPALPNIPLALPSRGAEFWSRLTKNPVSNSDLTSEEQAMVLEMRDAGIASTNLDHPHRQHEVPAPCLSSPMHELVYAIVACIARHHNIQIAFIKGPVLHMQGLRTREHSGDVDVWVDPTRVMELGNALVGWGWSFKPDIWEGAGVFHSVTLKPSTWGCEIDIHRRFPGAGLADAESFAVLQEHTEKFNFASVEALVPTREAHSAIAALNISRPSPSRGADQSWVDSAAEVLKHGGLGSLEVAKQMGATAALEQPLRQAFPAEDLGQLAQAPIDWAWASQPTRTRRYLASLRQIPWLHRIRMIVRIIWPPRDLVLESNRNVGLPDQGVVRARISRLRRGLRILKDRR